MPQQKKLLLILVASLIVFNGVFAAVYFLFFMSSDESVAELGEASQAAEEPEPSPPEPVLTDEYYRIHFNYGDAVHVCVLEAKSRNSNLIQWHVDELSSRYNELESMYLIKVNSQVGTPMLYDEREHTCHIDPKIQGVAFYQEITRRTALRPGD